MVYKIFKKNNYIVVVDDRNFYYEEHCSSVLVLKRLATDSTYDIVFVRPDNVPQAFYNVPFADIRDEFNAPYASVAAWETWYTTNTGCQGGSNTASTLAAILATLQAQSEVEGVFVKDTGNSDKIVLQVRVWDQDSQTFINTLYFNPDGTPYTPVGPIDWVGTSGSTNSIITGPLGQTTTCGNAVAVTLCDTLYTEFFDQGTDLFNIYNALTTAGIVVSTLPAITGSVSVSNFPATQNVAITSPLGVQADCANSIAVALCQAQNDALFSIKNAVNGTLLVALDAATLAALETINVVQSGTWTVAVSTLPAITGTVALDAATLAALENITVSGTVAVSSLPPITGSVSVTGEVEIINAVGSPIPVTIVAPVPVIEANLDAANDQVGIYGYVNGASGSPVPLNVDANGVVAIQDNGGSITVDAIDLDIRNLTFSTDKVDASGSSVKLQDGLGNNITSTTGALDVNIASGVTLEVNLDQTNDQVQVYGSDLTAPVATDTSGHLQVDILTIPEVEIKNDAGNPIPVSGTVTVNQPVAVTDNGNSLTVDASDLDIRDLVFATDKVDVTGSSVKLQDNAGTPITSTTIGADTGVDVNVIGTVNPNYITPVSNSRYKRTVGNTTVTYAAGAISLSIQNIGSDDVTVDTDTDTGETLDPGIAVTWDAPVGGLLKAFSFKGTSASSTYIVTAVYP